MKTTTVRFAIACTIGALFLSAGVVGAAELPKSTQKMIKELKLTGSPFLKGMNEEASSAPAALVEAAKKEGSLKINASVRPNDFRKMVAPFRERYPFLKIKSNFGNTFARAIKPLIAFKEGRIVADMIEGVGGQLSAYMEANALMKIDDIPNFKNVPSEMRDKNGYFASLRLRYWCMTYNTNKIKVSQLPATWDDLLTAKHLRNGKIAMGNSPNGFMIMLWGAKGPKWSKMFMEKLFSVVKPQLRKEGPTTLIGLVAAGELDIAFPTAAYRAAQYIKKKAPVSWHCPAPVPISSSPAVVLKGAPHGNAAKLYINWFLSKEGQIAQYYATGSPPVHKDLQKASFLSFPKQILGREGALRTPALLVNDMATVAKIWEGHWLGSQGLKMVTIEATITKMARKGRRASFKVGGKTHTVSISGRRTKITIKGKRVRRKALKKGMKCSITYPGHKQRAKAIICK